MDLSINFEKPGTSLQKRPTSPLPLPLSRTTPKSPPPPTRRHDVLLLPAQIDVHGELRRLLLSLLAEDRLLGRRTRGGIIPAVRAVHPPRSPVAGDAPAAQMQRRRRFWGGRAHARSTGARASQLALARK